jgi:hypothetical protein
MYLNLYVSDESIECLVLSRSFKDEIVFADFSKGEQFLNEDESRIITPNIEGEIIIKKKREATFLEKAEVPIILLKAIKGKITVEELNSKRNKLHEISTKLIDRERDPLLLKATLKKIENHINLKQFEDQFKLCYQFLDEAINQNKNVLWELSHK